MIFDIETIPQENPVIPEFSAPDNYKDPVKIAAHIEQQRANWLADGALHAERGQVALCGFRKDGASEILSIEDNGEAVLLQRAFDMLNDIPVVGFNLIRFDLPFLVRRAMILGVHAPYGTIFDKRGFVDETRFIDILKLWQCGDRQEYISLENLCRVILGQKKETSGAEFPRLWKEDRTAAKKHLYLDLELTEALAKHLKL